MTKKLPPAVRKALILETAVKLATKGGVFNLTFEKVGETCDPPCSERTVRSYYPRKIDLFKAVVESDPLAFAEDALKLKS